MSFNAIVDVTIEEWANQTQVVLENVFSGVDKHIRTLTTLIEDGRLTAGKGNNMDGINPGNWGNDEAAKRAFYAVAIPSVWTETRQAPAVIDAGKCKGENAISDIVSVGELSYYCYKDRAYFIVAAPDGSKGSKCVAPEVITTERCTSVPMRSPSGLGQLDGKKWGTVTAQDLIAG